MNIQSFIKRIEEDLLPNIELKAESEDDPIIVFNHTESWTTIGNGNYAGVFSHPSEPDAVVKIYGRNHHELQKEINVYKKLGHHQAFSNLYMAGENYLVLKKIEGITLFNAVIQGKKIPEQVMKDIDEGIEYARLRGLNPFDVHGKNVVMKDGRGYIVDISDFYKEGYCSKWSDLKKAYYRVYLPFFYKWHPPVPFFMMEAVRKGYRKYKKWRRRSQAWFFSGKSS